jgi:DNA-binding FadR family transcriptional regulator
VTQDSALHVAVAQSAHNRAIVRILGVLVDPLTRSREESLHTPGRPTRSHQDHRRILQAIRRRDEAGARGAMLEHLRAVEVLVEVGPGERQTTQRASKTGPRERVLAKDP